MLDIRRLRAEPDAVKAAAARRGEDPGLLDEVIALDERRRAAGRRADELRAEVSRTFEVKFVTPSCVSLFDEDNPERHSPVIVVPGEQTSNSCHATAGLDRAIQALAGYVVEESQRV